MYMKVVSQKISHLFNIHSISYHQYKNNTMVQRTPCIPTCCVQGGRAHMHPIWVCLQTKPSTHHFCYQHISPNNYLCLDNGLCDVTMLSYCDIKLRCHIQENIPVSTVADEYLTSTKHEVYRPYRCHLLCQFFFHSHFSFTYINVHESSSTQSINVSESSSTYQRINLLECSSTYQPFYEHESSLKCTWK